MRKVQTIAAVACLLGAAAFVLAVFVRDIRSNPDASHSTCAVQAELGATAQRAPGYETVSQLVDHSTAIGYGSLTRRDQPASDGPDRDAVQLKVDHLIKGDKRLEGSILPICRNLALLSELYMRLPADVIVFLDGKDGPDWVPIAGENGIVPVSDTGTVDLSQLVAAARSPVQISDLRK